MIGDRRAEIAMQTIFFIMMSIFMVAIIVFGLSRVFMVSEQLSEQERVEIINNLKEGFEYCEDPLNRGNVRVIDLKSSLFNGVCVVGADFSSGYDKLDSELASVYLGGDNVVLFKSKFTRDSQNNLVVSEANVVDSFLIDYDGDVGCSFAESGESVVEFEISCE